MSIEKNVHDEELGTTYHRGPVILRGQMIPTSTTTGNLLAPEDSTDWLHMDPWRVLRIQAEFVDGFGALAELGPAVTVFGSARTPRTDPMYRAARHVGRKLAATVQKVVESQPTVSSRCDWRPNAIWAKIKEAALEPKLN